MIYDLDFDFSLMPVMPGQSVGHRRPDRLGPTAAARQGTNPAQRRTPTTPSRQAAFAPLWNPGLLDRLTSPLTRYHD
jgi:hypothetical protein